MCMPFVHVCVRWPRIHVCMAVARFQWIFSSVFHGAVDWYTGSFGLQCLLKYLTARVLGPWEPTPQTSMICCSSSEKATWSQLLIDCLGLFSFDRTLAGVCEAWQLHFCPWQHVAILPNVPCKPVQQKLSRGAEVWSCVVIRNHWIKKLGERIVFSTLGASLDSLDLDMQGYAPLCRDFEDFYTRRLYHRIQVNSSSLNQYFYLLLYVTSWFFGRYLIQVFAGC